MLRNAYQEYQRRVVRGRSKQCNITIEKPPKTLTRATRSPQDACETGLVLSYVDVQWSRRKESPAGCCRPGNASREQSPPDLLRNGLPERRGSRRPGAERPAVLAAVPPASFPAVI